MIFSKKKKVFLKTGALIFIFSAFCFLCVQKIKADNDSEGIIITEIMFDPEGSDSKGEWIEIYNNSNKKIDINAKDIGLVDDEEKNTCHTFKKNLVLDHNEYAIIAVNEDEFIEKYPDYDGLVLKSSFSLKNSEDVIKISFDNCKSWEVEIEYKKPDKIEEGYSLEWDERGEKWERSSEIGGTPGEKKLEKPPKKKYKEKLRINEILPNPEGTDEGKEYIEIYNYGKDKISLDNIILLDRNGKACPLSIFKDDINSEEYLIVKINDDNKNECKISIHNDDGKFSLYDFAFEDNIFEAEFLGSAKENVSYNFDGKKWRQSKFLTPGEENRLNNLPEIKLKIDKDIYENIYAEFEMEAKDKDKDKLKIVWDFGDGHKSYLEKTRHKYEKEGNYLASVKVSDGSEDVLKNFKVAAKKYPHQEVKIVEIMPNPEGLDSEGEWIRIKNNSNKVVDLKGWSVATGATEKTLVNHPVYNSIKIKPGEERKIKREDSYFSLGNKQAYVELRYPDGKVAHSLKYKEKETIGDNSIFQKEKGKKWRWIVDNEQGTMNKEQLSENNEQLTMNNEQQVMNKDQLIADNKTQEIGGDDASSLRITQIPVEIEISLEMYQKLKENAGISEEFGEFSVRQENEKYFFTAKSISSEHYAKKFLEKLLQKINTFLNLLFI